MEIDVNSVTRVLKDATTLDFTDEEMFGYVAGVGTERAGEILDQIGGWRQLHLYDWHTMQLKMGLTRGQARRLMMTIGFSKRLSAAELETDGKVDLSRDAYIAILPYLQDKANEELYAILMSPANKIIRIVQISKGGTISAAFHPSALFQTALLHNATSMIVAHNHPDGDPSASTADIKTTKKLVSAGKTVGVRVLDHIIVGSQGKWESLRLEGLAKF